MQGAGALVKYMVRSGWSMFVTNNLENAQARYEKYGSGKVDEDENDEDFDPRKKSKYREMLALQEGSVWLCGGTAL